MRAPTRAETTMKMDAKMVMKSSERGTPVPRSNMVKINGEVIVQSMYRVYFSQT